MKRIIPPLILAASIFSASAFCQTDSTEEPGPGLRRPRTFAISGELGMNSLASLIGPVFTWYANPRVPLDFGIGLGGTGLRPGVRARYLFSPGRTAWFGGLGFKYGLGTGGQDVKIKDSDTQETFKIQIKPSPFVDFSFGTEFLANNGFLLILNGGYSQLLGGKNYSILEGYAASDNAGKVLRLAYGSGFMLSASVGKAF